MNTTHGLMTPADIDDHHLLYDTGRHPGCEGHDDPDAWLGVIYCSRAEVCPGEE